MDPQAAFTTPRDRLSGLDGARVISMMMAAKAFMLIAMAKMMAVIMMTTLLLLTMIYVCGFSADLLPRLFTCGTLSILYRLLTGHSRKRMTALLHAFVRRFARRQRWSQTLSTTLSTTCSTFNPQPQSTRSTRTIVPWSF